MLLLLLVYSYLDLKDRRVANSVQLVGLAVGLAVAMLSYHLFEYALLHIASFLLMVLFSGTLFRMGSIGGADAKTMLTIALVSPGVELSVWPDPFFEAFISCSIMTFCMLLLGYLYQRHFKASGEVPRTPLVPFLLIGYLVVQALLVL